MPVRFLDRNDKGANIVWNGNNAAFTCPVCSQVFIVSGFSDKKGRACPVCKKSIAFITDIEAKIEWDTNKQPLCAAANSR